MDVGKIGKVAAIAKTTEQKSAKALQQSQQSFQQKQDQLDQLKNFKQEYEDKLGVMGQEGIAARQLQDYRLFLSKLNFAIGQQAEEVQASEKNLEGMRNQWISESRRKTALDHLVDEHNKKDIQTQESTEQKESDAASMTRMTTKSP